MLGQRASLRNDRQTLETERDPVIRLRRDEIAEDKYTPLDAGWDAQLEGRRCSDNPYAINNWKYYSWQEGWELAVAAQKDAREG